MLAVVGALGAVGAPVAVAAGGEPDGLSDEVMAAGSPGGGAAAVAGAEGAVVAGISLPVPAVGAGALGGFVLGGADACSVGGAAGGVTGLLAAAAGVGDGDGAGPVGAASLPNVVILSAPATGAGWSSARLGVPSIKLAAIIRTAGHVPARREREADLARIVAYFAGACVGATQSDVAGLAGVAEAEMGAAENDVGDAAEAEPVGAEPGDAAPEDAPATGATQLFPDADVVGRAEAVAVDVCRRASSRELTAPSADRPFSFSKLTIAVRVRGPATPSAASWR